jgi:hypothetical protein
MKYQPNQKVILLDINGQPVANAVIKNYEPSTKLYRVNYALNNNETIWVDNVLEDRLILITDLIK